VSVLAGALLLLLGAAAAMSWWAPWSSPVALTAEAAGATSTAPGAFLLVRLDFLFPSARQAGAVVASVGAMLVLAGLLRALGFVGPRRWLVFSSAAPTGLALVGLGIGGVGPGLGLMAGAGILAAAVHLVALARGPLGRPPPVADGDLVLGRLPARLGELLVSMERWVVSALAAAVGTCTQAAAWLVARVDERVVSSPADRVASGVERAAYAVEPLVGGSLGRVGWLLLAAAAAAVFLHAIWPGG
jgi:hypothetical protein